MQIAANIEQLARACFARLCPWIAKEYPEWPVEKSTTMTAYVEGYKAASLVRFGVKIYEYKHTPKWCPVKFHYITINGTQIGGVMFSLREALEKIESIRRGEDL